MKNCSVEGIVERLKEFVESTVSLEKISNTTKEYIEDWMKILAPFSTQSLFKALEDPEAYWEAPQVIKIPEETLQKIIQEFFPDLGKNS